MAVGCNEGTVENVDSLLTTDGLGQKTPEEILEEITLLKEYRERADLAYNERQNWLRDKAGGLIRGVIKMLLPEGYDFLNPHGPAQVDVQEHGIVLTINGYLHQRGGKDSCVSFDRSSFLSLGDKLQRLLPGLTFSGPEEKRGQISAWWELEVTIPPNKLIDLLKSDPITEEIVLEVLGDVKAVIEEIPCDGCGRGRKFVKFK